MHRGVQCALVGMLPVVQAQNGRARLLYHSIHQGVVLHDHDTLTARRACTLTTHTACSIATLALVK